MKPKKTHNKPSLETALKDTSRLSTNNAALMSLILSAGDKIKINLIEGDNFNGIYTVDIDGTLKLPYLNPFTAAGKSVKELTAVIKTILITEDIFKAEFIDITIEPVQWSAALVNVRGAVFQPGNIMINERDFRKKDSATTSFSGDYANKRLLSSSLKAAGGIRPDADLTNIQLIRENKSYRLDMSGILSGKHQGVDPVLAQGDKVIVPTVGFMQKELLRPSRITPPGFRVFLSNLTVPAFHNSASAIGKHASSLPLGSRLMTAAVTANCVGGTQSVNARRKILLAGIDLNTNQVRVIQRSLDEIYAQPNSDTINPYLLPNDKVACFDSEVSNWRDIARAFQTNPSLKSLYRRIHFIKRRYMGYRPINRFNFA